MLILEHVAVATVNWITIAIKVEELEYLADNSNEYDGWAQFAKVHMPPRASYLISDFLSHLFPLLFHFSVFLFPSVLGFFDCLLSFSLCLLFLLLVVSIVAAVAAYCACGTEATIKRQPSPTWVPPPPERRYTSMSIRSSPSTNIGIDSDGLLANAILKCPFSRKLFIYSNSTWTVIKKIKHEITFSQNVKEIERLAAKGMFSLVI